MKATNSIVVLAALALLGCATLRGQSTATSENLLTASAVVEAVDLDSREVRLRDAADGDVFTVTAGPEVRNLPQLEPGDVVQIEYFDAVTVAMADQAAPTETGAVLAGRAPEGAKPGAVAAVTETMVVEVLSYDANSGLATFVTPAGVTRRVTVAPELRDFAAQRRPGDRVAVTLTEAVAVTIAESGA